MIEERNGQSREEACVRAIPYLGSLALLLVSLAISDAAMFIALGFMLCGAAHFYIKSYYEDLERRKKWEPRVRSEIPYHPETVAEYMKNGREYWMKHYEREGIDTDFAESARYDHLEGRCDREICYFCHFHQNHAPYV